MGFLDHSTNNIIVDAVLTDYGRYALSLNDGSFVIYQFALGDDEVDYGIIEQFGRTVGKEKIEKNTPVMEALTTRNLALKNRLKSLNNKFLTHLPTLSFVVSSNPVTFSRSSNNNLRNVEVKLTNQNGLVIPFGMRESTVIVEMNHIFLSIQGLAPEFVSFDNIARYRISVPARQASSNEIAATIPVILKSSFSQTTFDTYAIPSGTYVRTYLSVTGQNSGVTGNIEVRIS